MYTELLNLSWTIQASLVAGYAAYFIAYVGLRHTHRQIDTLFIAINFSLIAAGLIWTLQETTAFPPVIIVPSAIATTCAVAFLWRKWGRSFLEKILRKANVSWVNDDPSALLTLSTNTEFHLTQIAVLLDDGTWLNCDDATQFENAPFGPCLIGPTGDLALYLTHDEPPGAARRTLKTVRDESYGDRITYVPANRIRQITLRHKRRHKSR